MKDEPPVWAQHYNSEDFPSFGQAADLIALSLNPETKELQALISVRGREEEPFAGADAWPGGIVQVKQDSDNRAAAVRAFEKKTGYHEPDYVEPLATYSTNGRDPRQFAGHFQGEDWVQTGVRMHSEAYLALMQQHSARRRSPSQTQWVSVYEYLPWEDLRQHGGEGTLERIRELLERWAGSHSDRIRRVEYAFGTSERDWNEERVGERLALLTEAKLVEEVWRDQWGRLPEGAVNQPVFGRSMAFDHRQMLADALGRLRGKLKYIPFATASLLPEEFTLGQMMSAIESIAGRKIHQPNFYRLMTQTKAGEQLLESTGYTEEVEKPGPKGELYRFKPNIHQVRLDPSLRLPWGQRTVAKKGKRNEPHAVE